MELRIEINADGTKCYYNDQGYQHREDGPAAEFANGTKVWYLHGVLHREDGPAIEYPNSTKMWYINGLAHREDGPAIEWADGVKEWWVNGEKLSEEEFNRHTKNPCKCPDYLK